MKYDIEVLEKNKKAKWKCHEKNLSYRVAINKFHELIKNQLDKSFELFLFYRIVISGFSYEYPDKDKKEMCIFCKNENTKRIIGEHNLMEFKNYYKSDNFKAFECPCCNAVFHFKI